MHMTCMKYRHPLQIIVADSCPGTFVHLRVGVRKTPVTANIRSPTQRGNDTTAH